MTVLLSVVQNGSGAADLDPSLYEKELPDAAGAQGRPAGETVIDDRDPVPFEGESTPAVTVKEHDNRRVEEYRNNDNLYMVKVTPSHGKPYYLIDDDGSGDMEMRRNAAGMDNRVPQWTLFSW
jgi:hypothetical protein